MADGSSVRAEATPNAAQWLVDRHITESRGAREALAAEGRSYAYHDVAALMNRAGNALKRWGVGAGDRVLLLLPPSASFVAAFFGAMKIGAVPVVGDAGEGTLERCLSETRPRAVVAGERLGGALRAGPSLAVAVVGTPGPGHLAFRDEVRQAAASLAAAAPAADAVAFEVWRPGGPPERVTHGRLVGEPGGAVGPTALDAILAGFARGETVRL